MVFSDRHEAGKPLPNHRHGPRAVHLEARGSRGGQRTDGPPSDRTTMTKGGERPSYSHSMVPGGFDVMSSVTRLTPSTSLMIRVEIRSSRS